MRVDLCLIGALALLTGFASAEASAPAFSGLHRSTCGRMSLDGKGFYSRLTFAFRGDRYGSSEVLYIDPKCEVSILEMASQGRWRVVRGNVLNLRPLRMQMRPLDPRMADSLVAESACGKTWENGVANEIMRTRCGKNRQAEYAFRSARIRKGFDLFECEGQAKITPACTRYVMSPVQKPAKALKKQASLEPELFSP